MVWRSRPEHEGSETAAPPHTFSVEDPGTGGSDMIPNLVQDCQNPGIINQNFDYRFCNFCISPYIINHVIRLPNLVNMNQVINQ